MKRFIQLVVIVILFSLVVGLTFAFSYDYLVRTRVVGVEKEVPKPQPLLSANEESRIALVKSVKNSVVNVYLENAYYDGEMRYAGGGSGVLYDEDSEYYYILTNFHVASGGDRVSIMLGNKPVPVEVVGGDQSVDLAVLKLKKSDTVGQELKVSKLGDSSKLEPGESVIAVGNALGFGQSITQGIVSAINRNIDESVQFAYSLIQTDAAINPGNSGGALINSEGEVIGINTLKISDTNVEGVGFAIPMNQAKEIADTLKSKGYLPKSYLGVSTRDLNLDSLQEAGYPKGVLVITVEPGSPADKAGIERGDLILSIGSKDTFTGEELRNAIWVHKPGDTVEAKIYREKATKEVSITFSETKKNR
ncbi:S1C family serine protease [Guggenheimella bovis]